jgi:mRNA interferase RelE/StbE
LGKFETSAPSASASARGNFVLARAARDALASLDFLLADAILDALAELERGPDAGHELRGRLSGLRSYRVGAYRIIHELRDATTVRVAAIRHRAQAYGTDPR